MILRALFSALLVICLVTTAALAVNTVTKNGPFVEIVLDGSTDWNSNTLFPNGMRLTSVVFYPSAANDIIKIRTGSATGPVIMQGKDTTGGGLIQYFDNTLARPYIKASECTFGTAANVRILLNYK